MTTLDASVHEGRVEDLLSEWQDVFAADPEVAPFASPAWARACWRLHALLAQTLVSATALAQRVRARHAARKRLR